MRLSCSAKHFQQSIASHKSPCGIWKSFPYVPAAAARRHSPPHSSTKKAAILSDTLGFLLSKGSWGDLSALVRGDSLFNELAQSFALFFLGDCADNGIAHNVAVSVNHIGGGISKNVGGELTRFAVGIKVNVLIGSAFLCENFLCLGNGGLVAIKGEGV